MTDDKSNIPRRTVLKATGLATAGAAGLSGVASAQPDNTQTDSFTVTGNGESQSTGGTIETVKGNKNAVIDLEEITIHSVNESAETAVVSVVGTATTGNRDHEINTARQTVPVEATPRNGASASAASRSFVTQVGCPEGGQETLITLDLEDLVLDVIGLVVAVYDIELAICCDPDRLLGQLLCGLLVTE